MLDQLCGVLDIEAFQHKKLLIYREFALAPLIFPPFTNQLYVGQDVLSHSVLPGFLPSPEERDVWFTFRTLKYKIHGLDLYPDESEDLCAVQEAVKWIILGWYEAIATPERYVIGFKGGNLEKEMLTWLNIPHLNLETYGCPSFHCIPQIEKDRFPRSCGQHRHCSKGEDHCSIKETTFYRWWILQRILPHDANEVATEENDSEVSDDDDSSDKQKEVTLSFNFD